MIFRVIQFQTKFQNIQKLEFSFCWRALDWRALRMRSRYSLTHKIVHIYICVFLDFRIMYLAQIYLQIDHSEVKFDHKVPLYIIV